MNNKRSKMIMSPNAIKIMTKEQNDYWHGQNQMYFNNQMQQQHVYNQQQQQQMYNQQQQQQMYNQQQQQQMYNQHAYQIQEQIRVHNQNVYEYQQKENIKKIEHDKIELEKREIYKKMEDKKYRDSLNIKTELCETYNKGKKCYKKFCTFAHSKAELNIKKCGYDKFCNCITYKNNICENNNNVQTKCLKLHESIESTDDYYIRCQLKNPIEKFIIILEDEEDEYEDEEEDEEYKIWKNDCLIKFENDYKEIKRRMIKAEKKDIKRCIMRSKIISEIISDIISDILY